MLQIIAIGLVVVIVAFLIAVLLQPANFRISRSASFAASPALLFGQFNDFHKWNVWSPWARMDPNVKNIFDGPDAGVGSSFAWAGNAKVGEGRMTITESQPSDRIAMKLEFFKPFVATHATEFLFHPEGPQTTVTWTMSGQNSFVGKVMVLLMNCDKMIGGQFESGFANLREIVELKTAS